MKACDPQCIKDAGENVRTMLANILCKSKERGYCVYLLMNKYSQKFSQFKQFEDFKIERSRVDTFSFLRYSIPLRRFDGRGHF